MEDEIRGLRMENEFLKSRGLLRPDAPANLRCVLIDAEKAACPIAFMRRLLKGLHPEWRSASMWCRTSMGCTIAVVRRRQPRSLARIFQVLKRGDGAFAEGRGGGRGHG